MYATYLRFTGAAGVGATTTSSSTAAAAWTARRKWGTGRAAWKGLPARRWHGRGLDMVDFMAAPPACGRSLSSSLLAPGVQPCLPVQ